MSNIDLFTPGKRERRVFQKPGDTGSKVHGLLNQAPTAKIPKILKILGKGIILEKEQLRFSPITITLKKATQKIPAGKSIREYGMLNAGILDTEVSEIMKKILGEAQELRDLPESERIHELINLVHRYLKFAYLDDINELQDEEVRGWIQENTGVNSQKNPLISEVLEHGYGICRHFSFIFMWLAQTIGLQVSFRGGNVINIIRRDTQEKLFGTLELGESGGHAWVEVLTQNGWIRVDPTIQIVENITDPDSIFNDASYTPTCINDILDIKITGDFEGKISCCIIPEVERLGSSTQTFRVSFERRKSITWNRTPINSDEFTVQNIIGDLDCTISVASEYQGWEIQSVSS